MTTLTNPFRINGVISTDKTVMQNINDICTAAGCWMTFDTTTGKWSVIINRAGSSVASFNDSNIIGSINISGTGVNGLYNSTRIEYPHKDLRDQRDSLTLNIPQNQRFDNEFDNELNISTDLMNDPVQAQYLATVELKQSRVDKIISFRTDYSKIGVKAGDIIDVTSSMYGFTNKKFRVTRIEESDEGDGSLALNITALEYDETVYDDSGLVRGERSKKSGIINSNSNSVIKGQGVAGRTNQVFAFMNPNITLIETLSENWNKPEYSLSKTINTYYTGFAWTAPYDGIYKIRYFANWGGTQIPSDDPTNYYTTPESVMKNIMIALKVNGTFAYLTNGFTGDQRVQLMEDHLMEDTVQLTKGSAIQFYVCAKCNYGPNHPFANGLEVVSLFRLSGEVYFVSPV